MCSRLRAQVCLFVARPNWTFAKRAVRGPCSPEAAGAKLTRNGVKAWSSKLDRAASGRLEKDEICGRKVGQD